MFKKTTLDTILSDFTKTITKLDTLITANGDKVNHNKYVMDQIKVENETLESETYKAVNVKLKLQSLIS